MTSATTIRPDWVSHPGETIEDLLEERGWTQTELATRTGFTRKHVNDLLQGRASISSDTASRLSTVLGAPAAFWLEREAKYQAALLSQSREARLLAESEWLADLPIAWLKKLGHIAKSASKSEQVDACLRFFSVASPQAWRDQYQQPLVAFRSSDKLDKRLGAVTAWLRAAEREAAEIACEPYDKAALRDALPALRALTRDPDPASFVPKLVTACASVGVAVTFVPAPPGCPIHGATRWLSPTKALLALSVRYRSDDQLWFSFFHEVGHLLHHSRKQQFIEGLEGLDATLEAEADKFAADLLIPPAALRKLATLRNQADVLALADAINIAPGILVGRMQKQGWIPYTHLNGLKQRYTWESRASEP